MPDLPEDAGATLAGLQDDHLLCVWHRVQPDNLQETEAMKDSKIEWTDHTFNPWWGCVKVSDKGGK